MTAMDIEDDIGLVFDGGQDDELADLRLRHPLHIISRHRHEGWFAHPSWREDTDGDLHTVTAAELAEQMTQQTAEYRVGLTRGPYGWSSLHDA